MSYSPNLSGRKLSFRLFTSHTQVIFFRYRSILLKNTFFSDKPKIVYMKEYTMNELLAFSNLADIIIRSLNYIDSRLTGHNSRVTYKMMLLLDNVSFPEPEIYKILWTVLFHDIGLLRFSGETDEIFEKENSTSFSHAIYGALFMEHVSPFPEYAELIRYHHSSVPEIDSADMSPQLKWVTKCLRLLDEADLYCIRHPDMPGAEVLSHLDTAAYDSEIIKVVLPALKKAERTDSLYIHQTLLEHLSQIKTTPAIQEALLWTLIRMINLRSPYTSLHCAVMVKISDSLASFCNLGDAECFAVHMGALLHDIGKIAIPSYILDSPGTLSPEDWSIMKSHVAITEALLKGCVSDKILQIAIRHHERLDGTGYPRGLSKAQLTFPQRIVAVADITSALFEKRSYKEAFSLEQSLQILKNLRKEGKICPYVVDIFFRHAEDIYSAALHTSEATRALYHTLTEQYNSCISQEE